MTGPPRPEPSTSISALLSELAESPDRAPEELLPELRAGDVVAGRFELTRELGRGGFGLVFEARDRELGRLVAFKAIRPIRTRALEKLAKPLKEEAEAAARLNHPNVVTLHDSAAWIGLSSTVGGVFQSRSVGAEKRANTGPPSVRTVTVSVVRGSVTRPWCSAPSASTSGTGAPSSRVTVAEAAAAGPSLASMPSRAVMTARVAVGSP